MKKVLACFVVALMAMALQAQTGGVEKSITGMEQKWAQAQKASDANAIAPMLADSFAIVFSDGKIMNKSQALEDTKKSKMESVEVSDIKVTSYGDTATAVGIWKGKGIDGSGKPIDERERFIDTWHKMPDGRWQCIGSGNTDIK